MKIFPNMMILFLMFLIFFMTPVSFFDGAKANTSPLVPDEIDSSFLAVLQKNGMTSQYSPQSQKLLQKYLEQLIQAKQPSWSAKKEKFLQYALSLSKEPAEKNYQLAQNILYMDHADEKLKQKKKGESLASAIKSVRRFLARRKIFFVEDDRGDEDDIRQDHPFWRSQILTDDKAWEKNEESINREVSKHLLKKWGSELRQDFHYEIQKNYHVLFFDKIRDSGTQPKAEAVDAWGLKWKMKWSSEIHPTVMANRLSLLLGARYTDPVYATLPGKEGVTLILGDPKEKITSSSGPSSNSSSSSCYPITVEEFDNCFLYHSRYQTSLKRYFHHQSGIITAENVDQVLQYLSKDSLKKFKKENLIGRAYLTFKEALVEFSDHPGFDRGGPISWSHYGMENDRVARGLLLFNAWINNIDPNEDNSRGILWKKGQLIEAPFQMFQHDLGNSFQSFQGSGNINDYTATGFIERWGNRLQFNYFLLFLPGAWRKATYSDLLWMAKKIVSLKTAQIEEVVHYTYWPDFMQKAAVYKMLMRRNKLAQVFRLESLLDKSEADTVAPSLKVPLATVQQRAEAAERYGVPREELEQAYHQRWREKDFQDVLLHEGRVSSCESTLLIRLLHLHRHPTGLDRRLLRPRGISFLVTRKVCGGLPKLLLQK